MCGASHSQTMLVIKGLWLVLFDGFVLESGNEDVDSLLSRGGMSAMVNMVWLVLSSMMMSENICFSKNDVWWHEKINLHYAR